MPNSVRNRLAELGITLPDVAAPVASYTPAMRVGNQVWTSGQLPFVEGELPVRGRLGEDVEVERATECARIAALNALAAIDAVVGIDNVARVLKVTGFVASAPDFHAQPAVINGASDAIQEIFGEAGVHVRSAVGVAELPLDAPVEIEMVVEVQA